MVVLNEKMRQQENAPLLGINDKQPFTAPALQYYEQVLPTETQAQYTVMRRVVYCTSSFYQSEAAVMMDPGTSHLPLPERSTVGVLWNHCPPQRLHVRR